jgi:hypothetical protein
MATDKQIERPPTQADPDESPFELPPIEGLPLTAPEREDLRRVIEEFHCERAAASRSSSAQAS